MTPTKILQPILQLAFSALLSSTTLVFGAMPLLWLRRSTHGLVYIAWCTITLLLGVQLMGFEIWIPFLLNGILVFLFVLFESYWVDLLTISSFSVLLTGAIAFFVMTIWLEYKGLSITAIFRVKAEEFAAQVAQLQPSVKLDVDSLLPQIPSAFLILLALGLWIALLSESPWLPTQKMTKSLRISKLQSLRVPDAYIWIFLGSVVFAFSDFKLTFDTTVLQKVAVNILYISVILYFFQGVAIIGTFFRWQKMGQVWQLLAYVIFITQLFLAVSFLGLIDFWLDFRGRMVKKSARPTGDDNLEVEQ